jgi:autotransporter-associated beta strand protein
MNRRDIIKTTVFRIAMMAIGMGRFGPRTLVALAIGGCGGSLADAYPASFYWANTTLRGDNFQSHNQKIAWTANGLFRSGQTQTGTTREIIERSTDAGATWTTIYDIGFDNRPATVEADEDANVYVIYPEPSNSRTRLLKFSASNNYAAPVVSVTHSQAHSDSKFASAYDRVRQRLYHATQGGYVFTFDKSGNFVRGQQVFTSGSGAAPSYPHLFVDEFAVVHYAMTTADSNGYIPYQTIRYLKSLDGGQTWKAMAGTAITIPTTCASNGPSTMINLPGELNYAVWLANMHAKNGKVHFAYQTRNPSNPAGVGNPPTITAHMHYMRFNGTTGVREIDSSPNGEGWTGDTLRINHYSASFASNPNNSSGALYAAGIDGTRLNALVSYDNGTSWHDYARSNSFGTPTDPGLARAVTPDGKVIGCIATSSPQWATVNYFSLPADEVPTTSAIWDGGTAGTGSWGTADNWFGDSLPAFGNDLAVVLNSSGAVDVNPMNIGDNRTIRALVFNTYADSTNNLGLHNAASEAHTLTFDTNVTGGSPEITVHSDASGAINLGGTVAAGSVALAAPLSITHNGSGTLTINRPITETGGAMSLTKSGTGGLTVSGANTYSGGTTIMAGTLTRGANNVMPDNGDVVVSGTAVLTGNYSDTIANLALNSTGQNVISGLNITGTLNITTGASHDLSSNASATAATMSMSGGSVLRLGANSGNTTLNIGSGGLAMSGATMQFGIQGSASYTAKVVMGGNFTGSGANSMTIGTGNPTSLLDLGGATRTFHIASGTTTISPVIQNGGLAKTGGGDLSLSGSKTYGGGTTISAGRILIASSASLPGTVTQNGTGQLLVNGTGQTITNAFSLNTKGYSEASGNLNNDGAIRSDGNSTLSGTITLTGDSRIGAYGSRANVISGKITGGYGIDFFGLNSANGNSQTYTLSNTANDYTSATGICNEDYVSTKTGCNTTLKLGASNVIPNGSGKGNVVFAGADANHLTALDLAGFSETVNGFTVSAAAGARIDNSTGSGSLTVGDANTSSTFSGVIENTAGALALTKTGTGALSLTAANTYTGNTTIKAGTLKLDGNGGIANSAVVTVGDSATAAVLDVTTKSGGFIVIANQTLMGTGTISGQVVISGTLAPGAAAGTLTAGVVTFQPGSTFAWEIADWTGATAGTHWDLLAAAAITFNNTRSNKLTLRISGPAANFTESNKIFAIATTDGAIAGFDPAAILIVNPSFGSGIWAVQQAGNSIQLVYTGYGYSSWATGISGFTDTAATHDPDHDGLDNQTEYAFGLDPTQGTGTSPITAPAKPAGTFTYTRRDPALTGLSYIYQYSTTLNEGEWINVSPTVPDTITPGPGAGNQTVTFNLTGAPGNPLTNTKLFVRVRATTP